MPLSIYELMELYPQGGGLRPSVWYVPLRRPAPAPGVPPQSPGTRPEGKGPTSGSWLALMAQHAFLVELRERALRIVFGL